jgi:SNF2 family DNA or RNA helicase
MSNLRPAGFLSSIASVLFPKEISAEVRTEVLENGRVAASPIFFIDGFEVPAKLVRASRNQSILGYTAVLSPTAAEVHKETQGQTIQLAKNRAGEFLKRLEQKGIGVQSKDGQIRPRVDQAKPSVKLELLDNDSLKVQSELCTAKGVIVEKPADLEQLRDDGGWYAVGENLVHVTVFDGPLGGRILTGDDAEILSGDEVPELLIAIENNQSQLALIEKSDRLENLGVYQSTGENRFFVDGDRNSISIVPRLVLKGSNGKEYSDGEQGFHNPDEADRNFRRVDDGWIQVDPDADLKHKQACEVVGTAVGALTSIEGAEIPRALTLLKKTTIENTNTTNPWSVYFSEAVEASHKVLDGPSHLIFRLNLVESDGRSLFALDPVYDHDRFELTHAEINELIQEGQEWVRRRNAWIKIDLEKQKKVEDKLNELNLKAGPHGYEFTASQREQVINVFSMLGSLKNSESYSNFLRRLSDFTQIQDYALPAAMRPSISLREYQKHGFNWLMFLNQFGLNGILADDMGLGKTLQTLAAIQRSWETSDNKRPSLIVCPTSVVLNWKSEITKFFSGCMPIVFTGNNRDRKIEHFYDYDLLAWQQTQHQLVITSFDIARIDHEKLNSIEWHYVVVDEAHNIKNPDAKRTKAIKTINGQNKLVLTGTPIQNRLEELWSLFDFVMPGYLGSRKDFRDTYGRGGHVNWTAVWGGQARLKDRVNPFILRRLKENVAKDLPKKIPISLTAELSSRQVKLYKSVIESTQCRQMLDDVEKNGVKQAQPQILAALTKLRTICNHPSLTVKDSVPSDAKVEHSGKLSLLKELMEEVVDGEHRTLIFCQSTQMLDIIQRWFVRWGIRCLRLDGATAASSRLALVDEFNENLEHQAFLISTKAGGTGLNLTGADTVIFYDHDWNPANDNQAQDRAHRIGQTKPVTVYRLISRGTIEEKILERQVVKQTLADQIIGADEVGFKDLTKEELISLFTFDELEE